MVGSAVGDGLRVTVSVAVVIGVTAAVAAGPHAHNTTASRMSTHPVFIMNWFLFGDIITVLRV
jgi:hypothetical protein